MEKTEEGFKELLKEKMEALKDELSAYWKDSHEMDEDDLNATIMYSRKSGKSTEQIDDPPEL